MELSTYESSTNYQQQQIPITNNSHKNQTTKLITNEFLLRTDNITTADNDKDDTIVQSSALTQVGIFLDGLLMKCSSSEEDHSVSKDLTTTSDNRVSIDKMLDSETQQLYSIHETNIDTVTMKDCTTIEKSVLSIESSTKPESISSTASLSSSSSLSKNSSYHRNSTSINDEVNDDESTINDTKRHQRLGTTSRIDLSSSNPKEEVSSLSIGSTSSSNNRQYLPNYKDQIRRERRGIATTTRPTKTTMTTRTRMHQKVSTDGNTSKYSTTNRSNTTSSTKEEEEDEQQQQQQQQLEEELEEGSNESFVLPLLNKILEKNLVLAGTDRNQQQYPNQQQQNQQQHPSSTTKGGENELCVMNHMRIGPFYVNGVGNNNDDDDDDDNDDDDDRISRSSRRNNDNNDYDWNDNQINNTTTTTVINGHCAESDNAYIVEAVPVQSMILVTAQIVDNNEHNNNNLFDNENNENNGRSETSFADEYENSQNMTTKTKNSTLNENNKNGNTDTGFSKLWNWKYPIFSLLTIIISSLVTAYLLGGFCLTGARCSKNINKKQQYSSSPISTSSLPTRTPTTVSPTSAPTTNAPTKLSIKPRQAFKDRDELVFAVDDYLYKINFDTLVNKYGTIDNWDVSGITNFYELFSTERNAKISDFNEDLSKWNISLANDTSYMFAGAEKFNSDLSRWDVRSVVYMNNMFDGATNFQSDLSRWNVSSVETLSNMFQNCKAFTSDLSKWDVSSVNSMDGMFINAVLFTSDLSRWDVGSVTGFSNMFSGATNFTSDLSNWNMSNAWSIDGFVQRTKYFNSDVSRWDVSEVSSFAYAFAFAESFTGVGVDVWDVSNAGSFDYMFNGATLFDADLSRWNTSSATMIPYMFAQTNSFRGHGLEKWDLSQVMLANNMFERAIAFDCNVSRWDLSQVSDLSSMFAQTKRFRGIGLETWNLSEGVLITGMHGMFCDAKAINQSYISSLWNISVETIDCQSEFHF